MSAINEYMLRPVIHQVSDRITVENIEEIAAWCGGSIMMPLFVLEGEPGDGREIEFGRTEPTYARQGDRVVKINDTFHPLTNAEFERTYKWARV